MAQMVQTAMDPVTRNYQTSVAPSLDAAASAAGRYGSGTQAGLAGTAEQNLGRGLSDLSGNLYGQQFARERQAQDAAAQNYGQLYNSGLGLGMTGLQNAANMQQAAGNMFLAGQDRAQTGLQNAANTQNAAGNQYLPDRPQPQNAANQYGATSLAGPAGLSVGLQYRQPGLARRLADIPGPGAGRLLGAAGDDPGGTGLTAQDQQYRQFQQQQIQDQMARYYGTQQAPWQGLEQYMRPIGQPQTGSASTTTPYFSNPMAGIGSVLSGVAGLANSLGGLGGLAGRIAGDLSHDHPGTGRRYPGAIAGGDRSRAPEAGLLCRPGRSDLGQFCRMGLRELPIRTEGTPGLHRRGCSCRLSRGHHQNRKPSSMRAMAAILGYPEAKPDVLLACQGRLFTLARVVQARTRKTGWCTRR